MNNTELTMLQSLPLAVKVLKTKQRIREAIDFFGASHLYVPVSGGKDSMVLSFLVEDVQKELGIPKSVIQRVNSNTGNEYDDVLANARALSDLEVKPVHNLIWVLTNVGYPVGSKLTSRMLQDIQNPKKTNQATRNLYLTGIKRDGTKSKSFKLAKRWHKLASQDSKIRCSHLCCFYLKKEPLMIYEKQTGRRPVVGVMASEGGVRKASYMKTGCNAFNSKKPESKPIGFWEEKDILHYIVLNDLFDYLPSVYGDIVRVDNGEKYTREEALEDYKNMKRVDLKTTGENRTGCVWCMLGAHLEKGENRFQKLYYNDRRKYNFAINGGKFDKYGKLVPGNGGLGMGIILDLIGVPYKPLPREEMR